MIHIPFNTQNITFCHSRVGRSWVIRQIVTNKNVPILRGEVLKQSTACVMACKVLQCISKCSTEWHVSGTIVFETLTSRPIGRGFIGQHGSARLQVVTLRSVNLSTTLPNLSRWFWREIKIRRISYPQNMGKRYRQGFSRQKEELISLLNSDRGNYKFCTFSHLDFGKIHIFLFPNLTVFKSCWTRVFATLGTILFFSNLPACLQLFYWRSVGHS